MHLADKEVCQACYLSDKQSVLNRDCRCVVTAAVHGVGVFCNVALLILHGTICAYTFIHQRIPLRSGTRASHTHTRIIACTQHHPTKNWLLNDVFAQPTMRLSFWAMSYCKARHRLWALQLTPRVTTLVVTCIMNTFLLYSVACCSATHDYLAISRLHRQGLPSLRAVGLKGGNACAICHIAFASFVERTA